MAARGTINELYDIQSLDAQQQQVLAFVKQYVDQVKAASNVKIKLGGADSAKEITSAIKQLSDEQKKLVDLTLKLASAEDKYAAARLKNSKADTQDVKTKKEKADLDAKLAKEKQKLIDLGEKEAKNIEKLNNEYIKLNTRYKEASAASLKRGAELLKEANGNETLFQSLLKTDKEYLATTKSAATYNQQLLSLEQNVGRSQRNVGNYASAFNGLNNSFGQIARELPSLAINFQTFALAISNNLPIAIDEIQRVKAEIAKLRAEGLQAPSMFKQITSAIFSFQIGISLLITAFTLLAPKIADFFSNLFNASAALDTATRKINAFAGAADSSAGDLSRLNAELDQYISLLTESNNVVAGGDLDTLRAQLQISYQKETQAVKTANEAWQQYLNIGNEITKMQTTGKINPITGNISVPEIPKEELEKFEKQQADVLKIYQDASKQIKEEGFNQQLITIRIKNQKIKDEKEAAEKIKQELEKLADFRKKLAEDEAAAARQLALLRIQNIIDAEQRIAEDETKDYQTRIDAANNFYDFTKKLLDIELQNELKAIDKRAKEAKLGEAAVLNLKQLEREKYYKKLLDLEFTNQNQILAIAKFFQDKRIKETEEAFQQRLDQVKNGSEYELALLSKQRDDELRLLQEKNKAEELSADPEKRKLQLDRREAERLAIIRKYIALELKAQLDKVEALIKLEPDPLKRASLEAQAAALRLKISDDLKNAEIENLRAVGEEEKKLASLKKQLQEEIFNLAKSFTLGRFDAEKNAIQLQIDKIEEQKRKELEAINATTLPAIEKQARITNAEKKAQSEREKLQLKQRQLDRQRAQFEKAFNVAQIAINTIREVGKIKLAIAGHIATLNPAGAAIAASQIPIAIAIGAIQAAAALATPIPRFKTGKGEYDKYEGPAWVGDGGKSEMIFRENGAMEKTPATPVLTWVGKNDIIHPDANALMNHTIKKQGEVMNYSVPGNYAFDEMTSTLKAEMRNVAKTIKNKTMLQVNINNGKTSIMEDQGTRQKRWLNDNLQFGK